MIRFVLWEEEAGRGVHEARPKELSTGANHNNMYGGT